MKVRSIFVYTVFLQTVCMLLLWGVWIAWLKYAYLPDISEDFNTQQMVIARGVSDILKDTPTDSANFHQIASALESMYTNAMRTGMEDESYDPLIAILGSKGEILYSNKPGINIPLKPNGVVRFSEEGETWYLAYDTDTAVNRTSVVGESATDRHMLIGDPASGTAVPLLFILGTMLASTIITTYLSMRPLRETTQSLAARNPGNLTPISMKHQYNELRPVLRAINQLMQRVDASNLREKQFMADAAHELRTPIAAVLAQIHLLKQIDDPVERNEITADMETSLDRAVSLSRQLIDLARLETEDYPLKMEEIDLSQELSHTIAMMVPYALRKNIELAFDGPQACPVTTDKQALFSIINNILNNAVKYCPQGSLVETTLETGHANDIRIIIRDNGDGISEQYRPRLFSRFFRVPGGCETGSGLGLAIAQSLAEKIGGYLSVTDGLQQRGIGFVIHIPVNGLHHRSKNGKKPPPHHDSSDT